MTIGWGAISRAVAAGGTHWEVNCTQDEFLEWFPTVRREAAAGLRVAAHKLTVQKARK